MRTFKILLIALCLIVQTAGALAHTERPVEYPAGNYKRPKYRTTGPLLLVCKRNSDDVIRDKVKDREIRAENMRLYERCMEDGYRHLQAAVNAVKEQGSRIKVLPGVYREQPSLKADAECQALRESVTFFSYEQQRQCPNVDNLVAVLGDGPDDDIECDQERLCRLQIEGTGDSRMDVLFDGEFEKLNVIRADRMREIYFYNFALQRADFNAIYVIQSDGFVIDKMLGRWNHEYAFLTFASDHGLYQYCEGYGNGDSAIYPGAAPAKFGERPAVEVRYCNSHHNSLGFSGTAGDSVYVHHNRFHHNGTGIVMDSLYPDHPGLPQNSTVVVQNEIYSNNQDYFKYYRDGTCAKPIKERGYEKGVVCPAIPAPVGVGILLAGGNYNVYANNHIYDNWRWGGTQFWVPSPLRNETDPRKVFDTANYNRWVKNKMGFTPEGKVKPNGTDFWWDEGGEGNCWVGNVGPNGAAATYDFGIWGPPVQDPPDCNPEPPTWRPANAQKMAYIAPCALWSRENYDPPGCPWLTQPPPPDEQESSPI